MKAAAIGVDATFNNKSLADFGAFMTAWVVPPVPNTQDNELNVPGQVGTYDAGTELRRVDVTMQVGFWTQTGGRKEIRAQIRALIAWLDPRNGYVPVSFEEDPDYYLMLKLTSTAGSSTMTMNPESPTGEAAGTIDLQFKAVDPHWYSSAPGQDEQTVAGITSTAPGTLINPGGASTPMGITVRATAAVAGGFIINLGAASIHYNGDLVTNDTIFIDTDAWVVTKNGGNAIGAWSGDFPLLPPGNNNITINKASLTMTVEFTPRWLA